MSPARHKGDRELVNVARLQFGEEVASVHFLLLVGSDLLWT
jgi:hypothetical protein